MKLFRKEKIVIDQHSYEYLICVKKIPIINLQIITILPNISLITKKNNSQKFCHPQIILISCQLIYKLKKIELVRKVKLSYIIKLQAIKFYSQIQDQKQFLVTSNY
ncbi:hypothetical protein TTHERM_000041609 (macronuclear) [Tetrahymena thermophila SB210]|uniref:Uncharacterized protein n=1 Tax=Tetrahymena thermophila (strain SB210) TaxID=312017 RepID=W7XIU1_TETTS|nr:hypothetical protein TTHERM_000041609 [Tetrahymena thermophila SB210]EWS74916.1 hypothetical protein TTHERM_000041609 [Tetrahymena thermophila SB210]|eukprot:XP_012652629.1 hypothetical protein TTHERM_000041609 [Tetrahymena thermophila SB210]